MGAGEEETALLGAQSSGKRILSDIIFVNQSINQSNHHDFRRIFSHPLSPLSLSLGVLHGMLAGWGLVG